jgi:hypothetical protein
MLVSWLPNGVSPKGSMMLVAGCDGSTFLSPLASDSPHYDSAFVLK